jgi:hypothetical protein
MPAPKNQKIPFQEYQKLKEKASKIKFKFTPYPWPVLTGLLIPVGIFILAMIWYFANVKNFLD